jgi:ketosteroid isomerase-like protein
MENNNSDIDKILIHHLTAFGNNDLQEILKDYTDQSQILTPEGQLTGVDSIGMFFADFFAVIPAGSRFSIGQKIITDNIAYIVWNSQSPVASIPMGTDTFVFEKGKIRYHTIADYRLKK